MDDDAENSENEETIVTNFTELKLYICDKIIKKSYRNVFSYLKNKKTKLTRCFKRNKVIETGSFLSRGLIKRCKIL